MNNKEKITLTKYLNLEGEAGEFLCKDLFVEFTTLLPLKTCFSRANEDSVIRKINKENLIGAIRKFLDENKAYSDATHSYFKDYDMVDLCEHLLTGYVFYATLSSDEYSKIDIFKDPSSVLCIDGQSVINTTRV